MLHMPIPDLLTLEMPCSALEKVNCCIFLKKTLKRQITSSNASKTGAYTCTIYCPTNTLCMELPLKSMGILNAKSWQKKYIGSGQMVLPAILRCLKNVICLKRALFCSRLIFTTIAELSKTFIMKQKLVQKTHMTLDFAAHLKLRPGSGT